MSVSSDCAAMEWSTDPQLLWQSQYNTNPYLIQDPERTVTTHRLDLSLPLAGESAVSELRLEPQLHLIRSPQWHELDRNEYAVSVAAHRTIEYGALGVKGDYTRDTTLTSEFLDTGYAGVNKQRRVWSMEPYLNIQLSPATTLISGIKYREQAYRDAGMTPLVSYHYAQANMAIAHEVDDRDLVRCGADLSQMQTERVTSDDTGLRCAMERDLAESLRGSLTLGWHQTRTRVNSGSVVRSGSLAALDLTYATAAASWGLRGSRSIEPSGYGLLVTTDQLSLSASFELGEDIWASANLMASRYEMTAAGHDFYGVLRDRDYGLVRWRIAWRWLPEWTMEGGVDHARQRYDNDTSYASATTLIVQLAYRPERN